MFKLKLCVNTGASGLDGGGEERRVLRLRLKYFNYANQFRIFVPIMYILSLQILSSIVSRVYENRDSSGSKNTL